MMDENTKEPSQPHQMADWFTNQDLAIATLFANLRPEHTVDFLSKNTVTTPQAALALSEHLPSTEAIEVLLAYAGDSRVASRLVFLIETYHSDFVPACVSEACVEAIKDTVLPDNKDALDRLRFFARYETFGAVTLSRFLPKQQAIEILEPFADVNDYVKGLLERLSN